MSKKNKSLKTGVDFDIGIGGKKMERRVPQNFADIAIKRLNLTQDVDALRISGLERSVTMFQELKKQGIL